MHKKGLFSFAAISFVISLLLTGCSTTQNYEASKSSRGGSSLAATVKQYDEISLKQDARGYAQILSDDYELIDPDATVLTKKEMISNAEKGILKMEVGQSSGVIVKEYGDFAVVRGKWKEKGTFQGKPFDQTSEYTTVYRKEGGAWRVLSDQLTRIPAR